MSTAEAIKQLNKLTMIRDGEILYIYSRVSIELVNKLRALGYLVVLK